MRKGSFGENHRYVWNEDGKALDVDRLQDWCNWHQTARLLGVQISPAVLWHLGRAATPAAGILLCLWFSSVEEEQLQLLSTSW